MDSQAWLLLTDYASKYRISVSTLRRRIKSHQIPFRFENGKYFLVDAPPNEASEYSSVAQEMQRTSHLSQPSTEMTVATPLKDVPHVETAETKQAEAELEQAASVKDGPIIQTATKLLNELKRAYSNILHEKEEQIIQLKEEVSDLKTLVRVLEDDNDRLRALLGFKSI